MNKFDVIIAGGGMIGATAALALSQLHLKVALVEPFEPKLDHCPGFDQRAIALSASSVNILNSLNIWQHIQSLACPIHDIHVSDQGHFGFTRLHANDYKVNALGQVIPLDQTGPALWSLIRENRNIELFCPFKIEDINSSEEQTETEWVVVSITHKKNTNKTKTQKLTARLLLAADGTFSSIATMVGIQTNRTSYQQHAVIANISTEAPHKNRAFERFTQNGPLALLPLTRDRMSLVWCHAKTHIDEVMDYHDEQFMGQLQQAFGYRLGRITKVSARTEYPLALHIPDRVFNGRVLLMGNSAHTLHPIAGQGLNVGLRDVAALVEQLQLISEARAIGCFSFLSAYQSLREPDWKQTITATDRLVKVFSNDFLPMVIARNKALFVLDKLPFVKEKLAMAAMGFNGHSAKLTRGIGIS